MNILSRYNGSLVFSLLLIFLFFSCKSGSILVKKERRKGEIRNVSDAKLIKNTENNNIQFNTLLFKKFQAEININDNKKSFKANLYVIKDSVIIVSVLPVMGIEIFRIKFVKDSIFILDRAKKKIDIVSYNYLWNKFFVDIDFTSIQNILLNQFYCYPASSIEHNCIKKFKHYIRKNQYVLQSIKNGKYSRISKRNNYNKIIYHEFEIAPDIFKITKSYIRDFESNMALTLDYKEFVLLEDYIFPSVFSINSSKDGSIFSINIKFKDIELDEISKMSFKYNSDKYKIEHIKK